MLVLSRKKNEVIRISDNIEIEVLEVAGGRVRLGIRAPREIPVHRGELLARIRKQAGPIGHPADLGGSPSDHVCLQPTE